MCGIDNDNNHPNTQQLLEGLPKNWGKWGPDDEVGALNYLQQAEVLRGVAAVRQGKTFTLQVQIGHPGGDPMWPARNPSMRFNTLDRSHYQAGKQPSMTGGAEYCDDVIFMQLQGSTQYDALGHAWYDNQLWNGYDASSTVGGMAKASVLPIAERGVVGRAVLIDMARHRGKKYLGRGETFNHLDLLAAAKAQGVAIEKRDILIIRTGSMGAFYEYGKTEFFKDLVEPGLTYSRELVDWFNQMEIPNLVTDTIANEVITDPVSGVQIPLHCALMRNLGIAFTEIVLLEDLAEDCAADGQWTFLYTAAPLKIVGGSGAPVNPIVIK
ncbi:cyclase family protein [Pseudomonas chlororaphis]|uniref:cyclase family protein n=1 Tax=Pseudomonas TaxID=286 RepID=UPI00135A4E7F|nr:MULTISPECIES: cyclase family protein [Pseudomonas]KAF0866018.1 cyclase family protein [Pseudomonas sp. LD120]MCO7569095.1 cyclase family protein [Pseudomonas chlororaphis]MCO7587060.1 cyclase family protein [Pseudomonas chlororaphis]MCO7610733.1 cyclase family protein [Pseudomonas chlororaphis]NBF11551.1 cyclase family protein [Pseudomonas sp. Fl4BN1]